jgi:cysteinyl-tRNA synthetase
MLHLYNTLSRKLEPFKPLSDEKVKFYACGPTVYNYAHIGNLCCYTFDDIVIRSLEFLGYSVDTLMNLTDIDDKTIRDSQKENKTLKAFTELYTELFLEDMKKLNITSFHRFKPISELVPEMIGMTQQLLNKKNAYIGDDGSVYFDIRSFKNYGKLAHLDMKGMKAGARVNSDEYDKENVSDFALWKWYDAADGENFWEAEFETTDGPKTLKGRPGWHVECSACNLWWHGEQIDIHMGWIDLVFPPSSEWNSSDRISHWKNIFYLLDAHRTSPRRWEENE